MFRRAISLFLLCTSLCAAWQPQIDFDARFGGFREGGGITLFQPITQKDGLFFGQATVARYDSIWNGSLGLGVRRALSCDFAWGVNAFCDLARSDNDYNYIQGGLGAELLGSWWVARVNGYLPHLEDNVIRREVTSVMELIGNDIDIVDTIRERTERNYWGGDVEVGAGMGLFSGELWGYLGYLSYDAARVKPIHGPRFRCEYRVFDPYHWGGIRGRIGGEWRYDRVHKGELTLTFGLTIPLCRPSGQRNRCPNVCWRMNDPVYRQRGMWVLERNEFSQVDVETGRRVFFVNGVGPASNPGTQELPTTIDEVATRATNPGDIIILLNTANDDPIVETTTYQLLDQQVMGGFLNNPSITLDIEGRPFVIPNLGMFGPAVLRDGNTLDLVNLQGDNNVFGFHTEAGQSAITGTAAAPSVISDLTLNNSAVSGVTLANQTQVVISNLTIAPENNSSSEGIVITDSTHVSIADTSISATVNNGIATSVRLDNADTVTLDNLTSDMASTGLRGENNSRDVAVKNSTFTNHGVDAIRVEGGSNWTIDNLTASMNTDVITLVNVNGGSISNSTMNNNGGTALVLDSNTGTFAVTNNTMMDNGSLSRWAVDMNMGSATYTFNGNTITQTLANSSVWRVTGGSNTVVYHNGTLNGNGVILGFDIDGAAGSYTWVGANVTNTTGTAFELSNNTGDFTFTQATIAPGAGQIGLDLDTNTAGNITVSGQLTQAVTGVAINAKDNGAIANLTGLTTTSSGASATTIAVDGSTAGSQLGFGPTTINSSTAMPPVEVKNSVAGAIAFNDLRITGATNGPAVDLNLNFASIAFIGGQISNCPSGVSSVGMDALLSFNGTTFLNMTDTTDGRAIELSAHLGTFSMDDVTITGTEQDGVYTQALQDNFTITNCRFTNCNQSAAMGSFSAGVRMEPDGNNYNGTLIGNTFDTMNLGNGIVFRLFNEGEVNPTITNNTVDGAAAGIVIGLTQSGDQSTSSITNNTLSNCTDVAILVAAGPASDDATLVTTINANTISDSEMGVSIGAESANAGQPNMVTAVINNNTFDNIGTAPGSAAAIAIEGGFGIANSVAFIEVISNTITDSANAFILENTGAAASTAFNLHVTGNSHTNPKANNTHDYVVFSSLLGAGSLTCATIQNNTSQRGAGLGMRVDQSAGTLNVTGNTSLSPQAALEAENPNIPTPIDVQGTPTVQAGACPIS